MSVQAATETVHAVFPNYFDGTRVSYSFWALVEAMREAPATVHGYVLGRARDALHDVAALLPMVGYAWTSRWLRHPCEAMVRRFRHRIRRGDIVHFWMTNPPDLTRDLQGAGVLVVREMINCTLLRRRRELTQAYHLLGWAEDVGISDEAIASERRARRRECNIRHGSVAHGFLSRDEARGRNSRDMECASRPRNRPAAQRVAQTQTVLPWSKTVGRPTSPLVREVRRCQAELRCCPAYG